MQCLDEFSDPTVPVELKVLIPISSRAPADPSNFAPPAGQWPVLRLIEVDQTVCFVWCFGSLEKNGAYEEKNILSWFVFCVKKMGSSIPMFTKNTWHRSKCFGKTIRRFWGLDLVDTLGCQMVELQVFGKENTHLLVIYHVSKNKCSHNHQSVMVFR